MNNLPEEIITLKEYSETKYKEKGSIFIGQAYPVLSEAEAEEILLNTKKKFHDATHNCYTLKLNNNILKYSDDGEPSGTAGIRILNAIEHFNLSNLILIVTRYFGGVKLGVGPLGKAYYNSAFETLNIAEKIKKQLSVQILLKADVNNIRLIHLALNKFEVIIHSTDFKDNKYTLSCSIYNKKYMDFFNFLMEQSAKKVDIEILKTLYI